MELPQLKLFLAALGIHNLQHSGGEWAQASCPLAPFTHKGGKDGNPSFGVSVGVGEGHFNCFVCTSGSMGALVQALEMYTKKRPEFKDRYDLKHARELLDEAKTHLAPLPKFSEFTPSPYAAFEEWPEWYLSHTEPWSKSLRATEYLDSRGVTPMVADHFELRWDEGRQTIGAPFRTASGRLAGMRGRGLEGAKLKHYDYTWNKVNNTGLTWFNEQAFNLPGPLIIVEGQFDAMRVWPHHRKVVAILSAKTTPYKLKKLKDVGPIALFLDNDETGINKTHGTELEPGWVQKLDAMGVTNTVIEYPSETYKDPGEIPHPELQALIHEVMDGA